MDIMQLCRLCLVKDQVNIPIFGEQGDIRQIFLKITACLPVKVSKEDNLPKKICDGCLYKLELLYQFWNTTVNAEKQLLEWLNQAGLDANKKATDGAMAVVNDVQDAADLVLKEEAIDITEVRGDEEDDLSTEANSYILQQQQLPYQTFEYQQDGTKPSDDSIAAAAEETTQPPAKRQKVSAAPAQTIVNPETESDDDIDTTEMKLTKVEDDSDGENPEPTTFVGVDNEQPGPSGVGKTAEAPVTQKKKRGRFDTEENHMMDTFTTFPDLSKHRDTHEYVNSDRLDDVDANSPEDDNKNWQDGESSDTQSEEKYNEFLPLRNKEITIWDVPVKKEEDNNELLVKGGSTSDLTPNSRFDVFDDDLKQHVKLYSALTTVTAKSEWKEEDEVSNQTGFCFYCPEPTQTIEHMSIHFSVVKENRFSCHFCLKHIGMKRYRLMQHIRSFHRTECYLCRTKFSNRINLLSHLRDKHEGGINVNKPPPYQYCTICYRIIDEDVAIHKAKEHTKQCSLCSKVFKSPEVFQAHKKYVHESELRCDKCGIRLSSMTSFRKHVKLHDPLAKEQCERQRERYRVGNAPRTKCSICNKMVSAIRMEKHKKRHNGERVLCNVCGKSCKTLDLGTHVYQEHKPCKCPICNKEYIGSRRMRECRAKHSRSLKCDFCAKRFSRKGSLIIHQRLHTGEKPYPCAECDRRFYAQQTLYKHMLSHGIDTRANKKRIPSLIPSSESPNTSK